MSCATIRISKRESPSGISSGAANLWCGSANRLARLVRASMNILARCSGARARRFQMSRVTQLPMMARRACISGQEPRLGEIQHLLEQARAVGVGGDPAREVVQPVEL